MEYISDCFMLNILTQTDVIASHMISRAFSPQLLKGEASLESEMDREHLSSTLWSSGWYPLWFLQYLSNKDQMLRYICCLCVSDVLDTPSSNDITAVQKAKTLYKSCINESKCLLNLLRIGYINIIKESHLHSQLYLRPPSYYA